MKLILKDDCICSGCHQSLEAAWVSPRELLCTTRHASACHAEPWLRREGLGVFGQVLLHILGNVCSAQSALCGMTPQCKLMNEVPMATATRHVERPPSPHGPAYASHQPPSLTACQWRIVLADACQESDNRT